MAEPSKEPKESYAALKNIVVLFVIWGAIMFALFSSRSIRDFFSGALDFSKNNSYSDIIVMADKRGEARQLNFYADGKIDINDVVQSVNNPYLFYAATSNGIYASNDGGSNWRKIDLPKEIGNEMAVERIFTNLNRPYEMSILIFDGDKGIIYTTPDNFYSIKKSFEAGKEGLTNLINDRNISTIIPTGDKFIIGTKN